jgi:type I restriction enzyme, S subunit
MRTPPTDAVAAPNETEAPRGWEWRRSRDVFSYVTSGSRDWARYYSDSGPLFLRIGNLDHDAISLDLTDTQRVQPPTGVEGQRTRVRPGDILISITADVGMVGLAPVGIEEAYINQHVALARPNGNVDGPYLAWFLASPSAQRQFRLLQRGATKVGLGLEDIRSVWVPCPPVSEQQRIVAEIEKQLTRLEAGVAALRRLQANLKRYRAAVLNAACEARLVPTEAELARREGRSYETGEKLLQRIIQARRAGGNGKSVGGKLRKDSSVNVVDATERPPAANGWTWTTVGEVSSALQYGTSAKTSSTPKGVPVLRMGNILDGKIVADSLKYLPAEHHEFPALILQEGDLLFNRTNSAELVGKTAVYTGAPTPCSFASYLIRIRLVHLYLPKLLTFFINSALGRSWISRVVSQQVGQANVNGTKLQALTVPLPPLAEQERIVAEVERRLSVVEELEATVAANLQRAARLRQAVLQRAFTGRLVKPEPLPG